MNGQFGIFPIVSFAAGGGVLDLAGARGLHLLCTVGIKLISISGAGTDLLIQPHVWSAAAAVTGSVVVIYANREIYHLKYAGSRKITLKQTATYQLLLVVMPVISPERDSIVENVGRMDGWMVTLTL